MKFLSSLIVVLAISTLYSIVRAGDSNTLKFEGLQKCDGAQVEVTFLYEPVSNRILGFNVVNSCLDGNTIASWKVNKSIAVNSDGVFEHKSNGEDVAGVISGITEATGTLGPSPFGLMCNTGTHAMCTEWIASSVK